MNSDSLSIGKVAGASEEPAGGLCPRLSTDLVVAWDGSMSRCTHVWETSRRANIFKIGLKKAWKKAQSQEWWHGKHCVNCDQNEGPTKGETIE